MADEIQPLAVPNRADLASFIKDPKTLIFFEQFVKLAAQVLPVLTTLAQQTAEDAQASADDAIASVSSLQEPQYIVAALAGVLNNERLLTGDTGVSVDFTTAAVAKIIVNVLAILNAAPIILTEPITAGGGAAITGGLETDTLRIDQAETIATVTSDRWIPVNVSGTMRKLLIAP